MSLLLNDFEGEETARYASSRALLQRAGRLIPGGHHLSGRPLTADGPMYLDGWITDFKLLKDPGVRGEFEAGLKSQGRSFSEMEIVLETFAVRGSAAEARPGAELWRFVKKAWKPGFVTNPDPVDIQRRAEAQVNLDELIKDWLVSPDPAVHVARLNEMFDAGATTIFVHSPQTDQLGFIDWHAHNVLPAFKT
ncbi:MAG: hypothetical protein U0931_21130 [Vulcanimicrobiota bacterium]